MTSHKLQAERTDNIEHMLSSMKETWNSRCPLRERVTVISNRWERNIVVSKQRGGSLSTFQQLLELWLVETWQCLVIVVLRFLWLVVRPLFMLFGHWELECLLSLATDHMHERVILQLLRLLKLWLLTNRTVGLGFRFGSFISWQYVFVFSNSNARF